MVYLIHFDKPLKHAQHYLGSTPDDRLATRLHEHRTGKGATLTKYAVQEGICLELARTWPGGRTEESHYKKPGRGNTGARTSLRPLCPICKAEKASVTA